MKKLALLLAALSVGIIAEEAEAAANVELDPGSYFLSGHLWPPDQGPITLEVEVQGNGQTTDARWRTYVAGTPPQYGQWSAWASWNPQLGCYLSFLNADNYFSLHFSDDDQYRHQDTTNGHKSGSAGTYESNE